MPGADRRGDARAAELPPLLVLETSLLAPEIADLATDAGFEVAGPHLTVEHDRRRLDRRRARCHRLEHADRPPRLPQSWLHRWTRHANRDHVSVLPEANIAGACVVGRAAYIAMGATVTDRITIGEESVVAAGAVVVEDVPAEHTGRRRAGADRQTGCPRTMSFSPLVRPANA